MANDDLDFRNILAQSAEAFNDLELFDDWVPPDGDYTVVGQVVRSGTSSNEEAKTKYAWWNPPAQIIDDGEFHERTFSMGYASTNTGWSFARVCFLYRALMGKTSKVPAEINRFLREDYPGMVFTVSIARKVSKKNGKIYPEIRVTGVVPTDAPPTS